MNSADNFVSVQCELIYLIVLELCFQLVYVCILVPPAATYGPSSPVPNCIDSFSIMMNHLFLIGHIHNIKT